MKDRAPSLVLGFAFALLGLPACGTQDITANQTVVAGTQNGPDVESLAVVFPPLDDTYEAYQARLATNPTPTQYQVWMDGQLMMSDAGDGTPSPFVVSEGAISSVGYFKAAPHHFMIAAPGSPPIFEGDSSDAVGNGTVTLLLNGTRDSLTGRFYDSSTVPWPGMQHMILFNFGRNGQSVEMVKCTSATDCTHDGDGPWTGASSYVDDEPASGPAGSSSSLDADGVGYGYRMLPTAAVPNPPVQPLHSSAATPGPNNFFAAPVYLSDQGEPELVF